jgi:serine hydrolase
MKSAFIIHGTYGNSKENWFPWLKQELEKSDYKVVIPDFPTPENQTLENWLNIFKKHEKDLNEKTILIGHSLGCAFILTLLEKHQAKAAYLVSAFIGTLDICDIDELNFSFTEKKFDRNKIKSNCNKFTLFHSDNDPYVPLKKAEELKNKLDAKLIMINQAGHFNEKSGYKKFEEIKNKIIQDQKD